MTMGICGMWRLWACRPPCKGWSFSSIFFCCASLLSIHKASCQFSLLSENQKPPSTMFYFPACLCLCWLAAVCAAFSFLHKHTCACILVPCYFRQIKHPCDWAKWKPSITLRVKQKHLAFQRRRCWTRSHIAQSLFLSWRTVWCQRCCEHVWWCHNNAVLCFSLLFSSKKSQVPKFPTS